MLEWLEQVLHRIRLAMKTGTFLKLSGRVEADETFIGGAARFMHKDKKAARARGKLGGMVGDGGFRSQGCRRRCCVRGRPAAVDHSHVTGSRR